MLLPGLAPANAAAVGEFMGVDPFVRPRLAEAEEVLGYPLEQRFRSGGAGADEYRQLAFLINTLALADRAEQRLRVTPAVCLAPSFGLLAAIVHLGVLPFADVVRLVAHNARHEAEFLAGPDADVVTYYVFRTPEDALREVLGEMAGRAEWAEISGRFDAGFFAVSMRASSVAGFTRGIRERAGVPLYRMSPPVHCSRLGPVRDRLAALCPPTFTDPRVPLISELDGSLVRTGAGVRALLLDGVVGPIRWPDAVAALERLGVRTVCVPGPSNLFDRLVRTRFDAMTVTPESALRDDAARVPVGEAV
jgi:[acyl-carrier-protein] S-malonyltransferase